MSSEPPRTAPVLASVPRPIARLVFAIAFATVGIWVARGFVIPLGWSFLVGVALWPLYRRAITMLPLHWPACVAPLLFTLATALVLIVPLGLAAVQIGHEGEVAIEWLGRVQESGLPAPRWVERLPIIGSSIAGWWREHLADPHQLTTIVGDFDRAAMANWTKLVAGKFAHLSFVFVVTVLALFFVFRDGEWLGGRLLDHANRVLGDPGERLAERLVLAARGTFNGTVLVAVGEGVLIGIGYVIAGVPEPMLFGALTIAFAMLPFGAWFAFSTAALVLLSVGGSALAAALVFTWGAAVMLLGDNFIQPTLIGSSIRLPFMWTLIGILGGAQTFGLIGLFIGPTIMSGLITIWREWIERPQRGREPRPPNVAGRPKRGHLSRGSDPVDLIP